MPKTEKPPDTSLDWVQNEQLLAKATLPDSSLMQLSGPDSQRSLGDCPQGDFGSTSLSSFTASHDRAVMSSGGATAKDSAMSDAESGVDFAEHASGEVVTSKMRADALLLTWPPLRRDAAKRVDFDISDVDDVDPNLLVGRGSNDDDQNGGAAADVIFKQNEAFLSVSQEHKKIRTIIPRQVIAPP